MSKYCSSSTGSILVSCLRISVQDSAGWTPLMIASSLRDGDDVLDLLLNKEADVNMRSMFNVGEVYVS